MRIAVDLTLCQGYAQCCFLAPEVFRFNGQEALMYMPEPDAEERERVLRAVKACPVQAILVDVADGLDPA
jgi:ferredoxin